MEYVKNAHHIQHFQMEDAYAMIVMFGIKLGGHATVKDLFAHQDLLGIRKS